MAFELPVYCEPNFEEERFKNAPDARVESAPMDGVAPDGYHSTSMYPEYFKLNGAWRLAEESRMDSSVVLRLDGRLDVVENRNLRRGDRVLLGRSEEPIAQVAEKVGILDVNYFTKMFKKTTGVTPTQDRRDHRER